MLSPEPLRTCVGCRQVKPRGELQRLAAVDGTLVLNPRRVAGRSAYLCPNSSCWTVAEKRRAVERALAVRISAEDWDRLRQGILS
ncbi:MAG: YlxR family protein [Chloroflexi bacterium]|nr:MAG: YlxR family protein [Chloroflexota bacterium]